MLFFFFICSPFDAKDTDFTRLLSQRELACLQGARSEYVKRFKKNPGDDDDLLVFLGDTFSRRQTWSGSSRRVPTFRTGGGLMWWFAAQRPMTSRERLATLAFPVSSGYAESMSVPELPCRDSKRAASIAGNSMSFATVMIVQLVALVSFKQSN